MEIVEIKTESIKLDQVLKWSNAVSSGGEAKLLIQEGQVLVNGVVETKRSKKVYPNDVITIGNQTFRIT